MNLILMLSQYSRIARRPLIAPSPSLRSSLFCLTLLWLLLPLQASAAEAPETIDPEKSCATGKCHTAIANSPFMHWADFTDTGECESCHEFDENAHEFDTDGSNENCLDCHDEILDKMETAKVVHEAAEDGCIDCHNPHGGKTVAMLEGIDDQNLKSLCFDCHEAEILDKEEKHDPAAEGECNECHDPHASENNVLLLADGIELCLSCHDDVAEEIENSDSVHDPAEDSCIDCHNPHSGSHPLMLFAEKRELCNDCHDDIVEIAENASSDHSPTITGDECLNCHSAHAGNASPNLKMPERELCLSCHDKPVESGNSILKDMKSWLEANPNWHEPVAEDACAACHDPHGSDHFRNLKEASPKLFYDAFDIENFALCFSCHEQTLVLNETTRSLTGFRDGNQNLHFLHVNRENKGRTCRACHDVHASTSPLQVAKSVPFGKWKMPIDFEKTVTGGSCAPGCHEPEDYDRTR